MVVRFCVDSQNPSGGAVTDVFQGFLAGIGLNGTNRQLRMTGKFNLCPFDGVARRDSGRSS